MIRIARLDPGQTSFAQATSWAANAPIVRRPSVAIGGGDIYVAFDTEQNLNPVVVSTVQIARLAAGATDPTAGTFGGKLDQELYNPGPPFNQPPRRVLEPSLAVQGDTVHALWERTVDGTTSSFTEVPHATRALTDATFTGLPSVVTFSPGAADEQIQASLRPPGGSFGSLEDVSGVQVHPEAGKSDAAAAAVGAGGQALIAWSADDRSGAANQRIFVSERDANPPVIGSLTVPDATTAGTAVSMSAQASDSISAVSIGWDFNDGSRGAGSSLTHTFATPGSYTVTVTARDAAGDASTATRTINVAPAPNTPTGQTPTGQTPTGQTPTGQTPSDQTPPVISALKVTNARFRISRVSTAALAARHKTPIGTAFTLNLSERSTLRLAIVGRLPGRKAGKRCVIDRKHGTRCSTVVSPGPIVRSGRGPGQVAIPFSGRVGSRTLPPGSYLAMFTAVDNAGADSTPKTVRIAVVAK